MLKDGVNNIPLDPGATPESFSSKENARADEMQRAEEFQKYSEFGRDKPHGSSGSSKSNFITKQLMTTFMAVTAVVVLTVSPISVMEPIFGPVLEPVLGPATGADDGGMAVEFLFVDASDDTIWYTVSVEGLEGGESVSVKLSNRFTDRSSQAGSGISTGQQSGLKPGMDYTLAVVVDGKTVSSTHVKTLREAGEIYVYNAVCTCTEDGMFHFGADIHEEEGVQAVYSATLSDWYGNSYTISLDPGENDYSIPIVQAGLMGDTAVLMVHCEKMEEGELTESVLFEREFEI